MADEAGLAPTLDAAGYAWPEEENALLGVSDLADYLIVERLFVDVYLPSADLRLGRQAVNWGSAFLINPTDPFPEVLLLEPWRNRSGVNALRATIPVGDLHQGQLVVSADDTFTSARAAARATAVLGGVDLSLVGAWDQTFDDQESTLIEQADPLVGLDVRGTLGVGFWLEGAVHLDAGGDADPYEELAVGVDYSFPVLENLIVTAQYYRSGRDAGDADPAAALVDFAATDDEESDPFAPFFSGENYAMGAVNLGVLPEIGAGALWIQNLDDGTALAAPTLSAYPTDRLDLSLVGQIPLAVWGDGGELEPAEEDLLVSAPTIDGDVAELDLGELLPDATLTLQARFNF